MPSLLRRPLRGLLSLLFLTGLSLALWLGQGLPLPGVASVATASPAQLVQEGVALYQTGDYQSAIDRWQTALQTYPTGTD